MKQPSDADLGESWRWQVVSFRPAHALGILPEPVQYLEAKRLEPLAERCPELECEVGTRTQVLAPVRLHLQRAGPSWYTGRDYFDCLPLAKEILKHRWHGLFLRLRSGGDRVYPYQYPHSPPGLVTTFLTALPGLIRQPERRLQIVLLEEFWQRQLFETGSVPSNDHEYYEQKIHIKSELLAGRAPSAPGIRPMNAADQYLLQASLEQYAKARRKGERY